MERFLGTRSLRRLRDLAASKSAAASSRRRAGRRPTFELLEDRRVFALQVVVVLPSLVDSGGASTAWVSRTGSLAQPLAVTLVSSDPAAATVPSTVIIPANATAAPFDVTVVDDDSLNASVTVTITASAAGHANASDEIAIVNDEFLALPAGTATDVVNVSSGAQPGQFQVNMGPQAPPSLGTPVYASFVGEYPYQTSGANVAVQASEFFPVDVTKTYALAGWAKSGDEFGQRYNPANRQSFGFAAYDANYTLIPPQPGEPYSLIALDSQAVPGDWSWKQYAAVFTGQSLPSGTAFIKPVIVANEHGAADNFISWRDVSVTQVPAGTAAAALTSPVVDLSLNPAGDQRHLLPMDGTHADRLVKVDVNARYTMSALGQRAPELNERVFGFDSYDVDKKLIHPLHVSKHGYADDTQLIVDLMPGDTSIFIRHASGWSTEPWEPAESRSLAWYGYQDSTGHTYANYTYTRNVAFDFEEGLWAPGAIHHDATTGRYRIELNKPWSGPAIARGTAIRNATSGESLSLAGEPQVQDPATTSTMHTAAIGGGVWQQGRRDENTFRPGTAYIQPAFNRPLAAREVVIGPESDAVYGGPLDTTRQTLEVNASQQASLDLFVMPKGYFWGSAPVVIDSVAQPAYGTATIVPSGGPDGLPVINYLSPPSFLGSVVLQYTLRNTANNQTVTRSVTINVLGGELQALGTLPSQINDPNYSVAAGESLNGDGVDAPKLVSESNGAPNTTARLIEGPKHGALRFNSNGTFVYTPAAGFAGIDTFRFETLRASGVATLTAKITVYSSADELVLRRLRAIGFGMQNYESARDRFPVSNLVASHFDATGKPFLSWRVHLLPYIGYQSLYAQFRLNEAWNSAHNAPLAAQMPDIFRSAGDAGNSTTTRFQIISGEGSPYYWRRVSGLLAGPTLSSFPDGTEDTLLVVERGANLAITWTRPEAQDFNVNNPLASLGAIASDRIHAVMADGRTITLPATIDAATFKSLVTTSGGEIVDADTLRRQFAEQHGGAAAAYSFGAQASDGYFKNIVLAMLNYEQARQRFPVVATNSYFDANGNPYLSWRVHLLPYFGYQALYSQFNLQEPWNSATNLPLLSKMPDVFRSAGDASTSTSTRVLTFTGPDAPFGRNAEGSIQSGPRIQQFTDGTSNTILFLEAGPDRAVPWTKPEDVPLDVSNPLAALGDLSSGEVRVAFADGAVRRLPVDLPPATFAAMATMNGGEPVNRDTIASRELARTGGASFPVLQNKYKQIALAMLNYEGSFGRLPASRFSESGQPLLSWRVLILPWLDEQALYSKFHLNEPWDSPHNLSLLDQMPDYFRSTGDSLTSSTTRAMTFTGPGAPFTGTTGEGPRFNQITDGSSNTFAVVEAGPDKAVPWTKPVDLPFNRNNPFSALGDLGPHLMAAFFDGSVQPQRSSISIDLLSAFITHNANDYGTPPPAIPNVPAFYVHQTAGDTATHEFGVDVFDIVLDKAPLTNVVLSLSLSNGTVAMLDKSTVTFTPGNWNVPQRVALRAVDDRNSSLDRTVAVTVSVVDSQSDNGYDPLANQTFTALVRNVAAPQPPDADFGGDGIIDGTDFLAWQRGLGATGGNLKSQGDADGDGVVGAQDLAAWRTQFGAGAATSPADFNGDTHVNGTDLGIWKTGFGTPAGAAASQGDADQDGDVDGADFLSWQRYLNVSAPVTPAAPAAAFTASNAASDSLAVFAPTTDLLMGLSTPFSGAADAEEDQAKVLASDAANSSESNPHQPRASAFATLTAYRATDEDLVDLMLVQQSPADADDPRMIVQECWKQFSE